MNRINIFLTIVLVVLISTNAFGWRMGRPTTLTHPLDERQVRRLNDTLQDMWNLGNGRLNLDVVTTTKSNPDSGDVWIFNDGGTIKLQVRVGGTTYSVTLT